MTRKLTRWARPLVGCTLGLIDCDSVSLRQCVLSFCFLGTPYTPTLYSFSLSCPVHKASILNLPPVSPVLKRPPLPPFMPFSFVLLCFLLSSQSHPACPKLSSTLHPSFHTDAVTQRPGKVTLCVGLSLMYAIHFTVLSPPTKKVLFLT